MSSLEKFLNKKWTSIRKRLRFFAYPFLSLITNAVVIEQKGGLASQLGLYVIGEYLKEKNHNVIYDLSWFETNGMCINGKNTRKWELENLFEINLPRASKKVSSLLKNWRPLREKNQLGISNVLETARPPFYWASELLDPRYYTSMQKILFGLKFKEKIVQENKEYVEKIRATEHSCAIHVRRGDFVGSVHDVLGVEYFLSAINEIRKRCSGKPVFFVFSNGFDWVKKTLIPTLPPDIEIQLMEQNDNDNMHGDFYLMSQCRHQIVSNSGFSWLSSLLKKAPCSLIIEPHEWLKGQTRTPFPGHICLNSKGKIVSDL